MSDPAASHGKVGQDSLTRGRLDFQRIIILQRTLMHADSHLNIFDQFVAHRFPIRIAIAAEARNQFTVAAPVIIPVLWRHDELNFSGHHITGTVGTVNRVRTKVEQYGARIISTPIFMKMQRQGIAVQGRAKRNQPAQRLRSVAILAGYLIGTELFAVHKYRIPFVTVSARDWIPSIVNINGGQ